MDYTNLASLTDRFGTRMLIALTDRAEIATGVIDVAVIDNAITGADAVINGYLAKRYQLPLAEIPTLIAELSEEIAIWKLHRAAPDPKIEEDYKAAIRTLKDISAGTIQLDIAGAPPASTGGTGARITDRERPLTAVNMKGFI